MWIDVCLGLFAVYIVMLLSEMITDLFAEWVKRFGRAVGWFGSKEHGDPARHSIYCKLQTWMMAYVFIAVRPRLTQFYALTLFLTHCHSHFSQFFAISLLAFEIDFEAKNNQ